MYNISSRGAILSSLMFFLIICPMAMPGKHHAHAEGSTMTMDLAKLLANDAIQALNHKDINGALEHLRVIAEVGTSANSTSILASKLHTHPGSHISTNTSKVGHLMNPSSGVMVRLK